MTTPSMRSHRMVVRCLTSPGRPTLIAWHATDITTEKAVKWLEQRDGSKPFFLMCHHKAPHRSFAPALRHLGKLDGVEIPEPANLFDDYATRSETLPKNEMEIDRHMTWAHDLELRDDEHVGLELPEFQNYGSPEYNRMTDGQQKAWDAHFGPRNKEFVADFKAGKMDPRQLVQWKYRRYMQNHLETVMSLVPTFQNPGHSLRESIYYAYYEVGQHAVPPHFGVRTQSHKLFYLPATDEWQMFDLDKDPSEMTNVYGQSTVAADQKRLQEEFVKLRRRFDAPPFEQHQ